MCQKPERFKIYIVKKTACGYLIRRECINQLGNYSNQESYVASLYQLRLMVKMLRLTGWTNRRITLE